MITGYACSVLLAAIAVAASPVQDGRLHDFPTSYPRPPGILKASDVCFSSRWKRPANHDDPRESLKSAVAFHATRLVWVYTHDAAFIAAAGALGCGFQCTLNSMVPDEPGGGRAKGRIMDLDGNLVTAPWMRTWKSNAWGCVNSPQWRRSYLASAKKSIEAGADMFQMDDPTINVSAVQWGGGFCSHCMEGFRRYLKQNTTPPQRAELGIKDLTTFDYRAFLRTKNAPVGDAFAKYDGGLLKDLFVAFQKESVRAFYAYVRLEIDKLAGRHVLFSCNNYDGRWTFPYDLFDFGMAELPQRSAKPEILYEKFLAARKRGKTQVFTYVSADVAATRKVIATAYACGGHLIVPWDVYMGSKPRYFGRPEDYADLYKFVRDNAARLDDYEDAAAVIPNWKDPRCSSSPAVEIIDNPNLSVFVRVIPSSPGTPIVLHLVDWSDAPQAAKLRLSDASFFGSPPAVVRLRRPGRREQILQTRHENGATLVTMPAMDPWGLLVISPPQPAIVE